MTTESEGAEARADAPEPLKSRAFDLWDAHREQCGHCSSGAPLMDCPIGQAVLNRMVKEPAAPAGGPRAEPRRRTELELDEALYVGAADPSPRVLPPEDRVQRLVDQAFAIDAKLRLKFGHIEKERDELVAEVTRLQADLAALQMKYDELTGERFSDRIHVVLQSRANRAEGALAAVLETLRAHEWDKYDQCRVCRRFRTNGGHAADCWLSRLLANNKGDTT